MNTKDEEIMKQHQIWTMKNQREQIIRTLLPELILQLQGTSMVDWQSLNMIIITHKLVVTVQTKVNSIQSTVLKPAISYTMRCKINKNRTAATALYNQLLFNSNMEVLDAMQKKKGMLALVFLFIQMLIAITCKFFNTKVGGVRLQ